MGPLDGFLNSIKSNIGNAFSGLGSDVMGAGANLQTNVNAYQAAPPPPSTPIDNIPVLGGIGNYPANFARTLINAGANLGNETYQGRTGNPQSPAKVLGNAAQIATLPLMLATGGSAPEAEGAIEAAPSLGAKVIQGGIQGAKMMAPWAVQQGLIAGQNAKNLKQYAQQALPAAAKTEVAGIGLGAAAPVVGPAIGAVTDQLPKLASERGSIGMAVTPNYTWSNGASDVPVEVTGSLGKDSTGEEYFSIRGSNTGVPASQLSPIKDTGDLYAPGMPATPPSFSDIPGRTAAEVKANADQFAQARVAEGEPVVQGGQFKQPPAPSDYATGKQFEQMPTGELPKPTEPESNYQLFPEGMQKPEPIPQPPGGFKIPGGHDPINDITANESTSNPKAFRVTTPQIQDAYRRNAITAPNDVYDAQQALYNQKINPALQNSPTRIPLGSGISDGINPQIVKEIQKLQPSMNADDAAQAASDIDIKLNKVAAAESGNANPQDISLKGILDQKTALNDSLAVRNYFKGVLPTNPSDIATVAARNILQKTLEYYAPQGVTQAVKDYGLLDEGFPSYLKSVSNPPPGRFTQFIKNPLVKGGATLAGLDILTGNKGGSAAGNLIGSALGAGESFLQSHPIGFGQNVTNNISDQPPKPDQGGKTNQTNNDYNNGIPVHVSDLPQNPVDVKPNASGLYTVPDPSQIMDSSNKPVGMSDDEYQNQITLLNLDEKQIQGVMAANPYNPGIQTSGGIKIQQDETQKQSYTTTHDQSKKLYTGYNYVQTLNGSISDALGELNAAKPNIGNLNGSIEAMRKQLEPNYAALSQKLQNIEGQYQNANLNDPKTKSAITAVLNSIAQQVSYNYFQSIHTYATKQAESSLLLPTNAPPMGATLANPAGLPNNQGNGNTMVGSGFTPHLYAEQ